MFVGEPDIAGEDNTPLPASSPSGATLDAKGARLYVTRAADNAVAVLDASTLKTIGAIPVGWYPTDVALSGYKLVVTNAKGIGTGPLLHYGGNGDESGKKAMQGTTPPGCSSIVSRTRSTGRARPSSWWRTTRRWARTTSTTTARSSS